MKNLQFILGFFASFVLVSSVYAQEAIQYDDTTLRMLYERQLQDPTDEYVQKRIVDERETIRSLAEAEMQSIVAPTPEEVELDISELPKALDRQRNLITLLTERLREHRVDLDLLKAEEERYYLNPALSTGGVIDIFRLTKTYPELLAMKAALEERVTVIESLTVLQESRLQRLTTEQRLQQFSFIISIGKYVLIVFIILLFERLIRSVLLARIKDYDRRYTVTKVFSSTIFVFTSLWLIGVLLAHNPGILASLAIIGAGFAIALQDVVKDVVGWIIIFQNRLFSKGERISVGSITGEVVDIGLLRTTVLEIGIPKEGMPDALERTGKILHFPNSTVLTNALTNYNTSSDFVKAEMRFVVTFESNWQQAKTILEGILAEVVDEFAEKEKRQSYRTRMYYIPHRTSGNQVYIDIVADGVEFTLRFTVPIGERRPIVSQIAEKVLNAFNQAPDIHLAYKTSRILSEIQKQS